MTHLVPGPRADQPARHPILRDLALLAILLGVAAGLRAWLVTHTEVAARDSIGYIRQAWQLAHEPWGPALRKAQQHPGYPVAILVTSQAVRPFHPGPESARMQLSAQLASSLAAVLLVIPMYYLGRELFNRAAGFWAALMFQCLPASSRVLADGLSEGVFLLFAASALLASAIALRRRSLLASALTGLCGGLAYLTRPEGAFVVAATGVVLLASLAGPARAAWRRTLACAACLGVTALLTGGPLVLATGEVTVKATPKNIFEEWFNGKNAAEAGPAAPPSVRVAGAPLWAAFHAADEDGPREPWAVRALATELVKGSHYVLWVPMLLGLWWYRDRFAAAPIAWVMLLVCGAVAFCLWRVAARMGYVSSRHTLLILLCGTYWAVAAVPELARRFAQTALWLTERTPRLAAFAPRVPPAEHSLWSGLFLLGLVVSMMPKQFEPLHSNRIGFRHAGLWLAAHAQPWDEVIDPYCWSHYHAGKVFLEGREPPVPAGTPRNRFVVLEEQGHEHSRLPLMATALALREQGTAVFRWTGKRDKETVDVVVYAVPPAP
jgi:hypothetical protein